MLVLKVREGNTWKDLDLYGNESINFNKSVLEVQEFEKRSSDFTKTFRIPGTAFNNRVMGNIFKINLEDSSFDPKQSLECAITNSGSVIIVGSLRLERMYVNVGKVDYEIVVYSQVGSLASTTAENTLCDLDFSEYTHSLSYQNISDSWDSGLFSGDIVYPFIHYGYDDEDIIPDIEFTSTFYSFDNSNNALPYWYYKPAIRVNKVVEKIINESGYELESNFMATDDFNNIYMPLSFSAEMGVQTIEDVSFNATTSTVNAIPNGDNNVIFDIEVSDTSNNYNNFTGEYTFDREGIFSFRVDYTLSTTDCCEYEGDPYYHLYDRFVRNRGGYITVFQDRFLGYQCNVTNVPFRKDITMQVGPGSDWQIGDKISFGTSKVVEDCNSYTITSSHATHSDIVYYECEDETTPITLRVNTGSPVTICANPEIPPVFTVHTGTIVDNGPCASIHPCDATIGFLSQFLLYKTPFEPSTGSDVVISKNMNCDITQLDFLKGIFKHYNMVVVPDVDDPVKLIIEPWNNWVNDPNVVTRDWTDYLDLGKDVKVQPLVDNDNRYVKFFDEEDGDKYNALYQDNQNQIFGEVLFDADTQILSNLKEVDTIFSPTPSDGVDGNPNFIIPHLYEEDDAGNKSVFATNPRLLYYNGMITTPDNYFVRDENNVNHSLYAYPCMSISQDLQGSGTPNNDLRVLSWNSVNNYYSQLTGYNTSNMLGSYYNLYWKDYFMDIYDSDSRLITAYFNLPFQEFIQTKLNDKIQISGLFGNTQWRINRIIDYDLMEPGRTKVELTKILQEPEPIGETRTYLLEKCDEQVENIANYNSFLPLTIGSSVKIEGFTDCYEVTHVYENETYDRYSTEFHELGGGNIFSPYTETYNIAAEYTWDWDFTLISGINQLEFELRYGSNGLPSDGNIIYSSGVMTGTGTYTFDNPNGLNIESYIYFQFAANNNDWEYELTIDKGPQPSPPTTSNIITDLYEDCFTCGEGDSGNIYVLEDYGQLMTGTYQVANNDLWRGDHIWDVGNGSGDITFFITPKYVNSEIQFEVDVDGTLYTTPLGALSVGTLYEFVVPKTSTSEPYVKTKFINNITTNFQFGAHIQISEVGTTIPQRLYGQSLNNSLTMNDLVYLGPNYSEHTLKMWSVIGKNSLAIPDVQITEPFGNGVITNMFDEGPSYLFRGLNDWQNFVGRKEMFSTFLQSGQDTFNAGPSSTWEYQGIGLTSGNPYLFRTRYINSYTKTPTYNGSPYWNRFLGVVKIEGVTEDINITNGSSPTQKLGDVDVLVRVIS